MGALPKNKITRAERGKRRAGNTPTLTRDHRVVTVPLQKRGLVNSIMAAIGLQKGQVAREVAPKKQAAQSVKTLPQGVENAKIAPVRAQQAPSRTTKRTQHKG